MNKTKDFWSYVFCEKTHFLCILIFYYSFQGDENEDDLCAISPSWTFDRRTRRWHRCGSMVEAPPPADSPGGPGDVSLCDSGDHHDICSINSSSSSESEGQSFRETASSSTSATATNSTTDDHETSGSISRCSANKTMFLDTYVRGPPSPGRTGGSSTVLPETEGCFPEKPPRKKGTSLLKKIEQLRLRDLTGLNSSRIPTQQVSCQPVLVQEEERMGCQSR